MKTFKILCFLILFTGIANAGTVKIGITHDLIQSTPEIWNLVKEDIPDPLEVSGIVGRNASHEVWQSVIDNASYIDDAMLFTAILPWSTILNSLVPADWPGAWKYDEEGNQTERKRWWEYTRVFLNGTSDVATQAILQINGPIIGAVIVNNQFIRGNFHGGCTDDLLKKYLALSGGFLTWQEGLEIINSWGINE